MHIPGSFRIAGGFPAGFALLLSASFAAAAATAEVAPPLWSAVEVSSEQIDRAIAAIDGLAHGLMERTGLPGMAVAVVRNDQVVYSRGFGIRKAGHPEPVDADTVFQLASVSKSVGATVVAAAAGRGWTAWNRPVAEMLPWFRLSDPYVTRNLTVGDLYSHRSGLPDHAGDSLEDLGYGRAEVLRRLRYLPLSPFRVTHTYTNFGLTAAAEAVAAARGTTWARLSQELIYEPLGMTSTSSEFSGYLARRNRAVGHVREGGSWVARHVRQPDAQSPAGGVSSSVKDMAQWMRLVLALGTPDGKAMVAREPLVEALTPQIRSSSTSRPDYRSSSYGYGVGVSDDGTGRVRLGHSGAFLLGAATSFALLPSENLGVITLTNGSPIGIPEALNASFLDMVETGRVQRDWLTALTPIFAPMYANPGVLAGRPRPPNPAPSRDLRAYVGTYANAYYGEAEVSRAGNDLVLALGPEPKRFRLSHWSGDQFAYEPVGENAVGTAAVWFRADSAGRVRALEVENFEEGVRILPKRRGRHP
ncbi:serine hydrolase [Methylococcus mesophilus]|uniref:serine hydrolase n=1 Tax=Methylococcus mesophilus TaxID=2993564 RepID=UPI00224B6C8A|nr:serine hydrolase [Methylococcus mesophilus]UZR28420.1 serine hydrolase [Methylococcus mesophilus]